MQHRALTGATTGFLLLLVVGCSGAKGATGSPEPATSAIPTISSSSTGTPTPATTTGTPSAQGTASSTQRQAVGQRAEVTHVVDGDTVDIRTAGGRSARIRVIGIDTPERGECNFGPASYNMKQLVLGKTVVLSTAGAGKDTTDRYGRWLRYVDVNGVDAGLAQITAGLAIARYDSRDGYGWHPREDRYVAAQQAATRRTCGVAAAPTPTVTTTPSGATPAGTAVDYGTCRAAKAAGAVPPGGYRQGRDVEFGFYRDADHDGYVCE
jgi:endonuclease YncB( thermonuclease family)